MAVILRVPLKSAWRPGYKAGERYLLELPDARAALADGVIDLDGSTGAAERPGVGVELVETPGSAEELAALAEFVPPPPPPAVPDAAAGAVDVLPGGEA